MAADIKMQNISSLFFFYIFKLWCFMFPVTNGLKLLWMTCMTYFDWILHILHIEYKGSEGPCSVSDKWCFTCIELYSSSITTFKYPVSVSYVSFFSQPENIQYIMSYVILYNVVYNPYMVVKETSPSLSAEWLH